MIKGRFSVRPSTLRESAVDYYIDLEDRGTAEDLALLLGSTERNHNVIIVPENFQAMVKTLYVNEEKRTVTAVFYDGKVVTKKAADDCIFDVNTGVALCIAAYVCGSTAKFHQLVERKAKRSTKIKPVIRESKQVSEDAYTLTRTEAVGTINYKLNVDNDKSNITVYGSLADGVVDSVEEEFDNLGEGE